MRDAGRVLITWMCFICENPYATGTFFNVCYISIKRCFQVVSSHYNTKFKLGVLLVTDRESWRAAVHGGRKEPNTTEQLI